MRSQPDGVLQDQVFHVASSPHSDSLRPETRDLAHAIKFRECARVAEDHGADIFSIGKVKKSGRNDFVLPAMFGDLFVPHGDRSICPSSRCRPQSVEVFSERKVQTTSSSLTVEIMNGEDQWNTSHVR